MIANRRTRGRASRRSSSRLPAIGGPIRQPGDVASRPRQTGNQASANRIVAQYEYDWDHRRCLLYRRSTAVIRQNDVDLEPDKLGRDLGNALGRPSDQRYSMATVR